MKKKLITVAVIALITAAVIVGWVVTSSRDEAPVLVEMEML